MGWVFLYNCPDKSQIIEECTKETPNRRLIKKSVVGNHLWIAWHLPEKNIKFIELCLLEKRDGDWGYKNMDEGMGPYYYDCPLSLLKEVPVENEEWRAKVLQHHNLRKVSNSMFKKIEIGSIVKLKNSRPSEFQVVSLNPFVGLDLNTRERYKLVKARVISVSNGE